MSLGLDFALDGNADLRRLDPWLQEDVLDELERLTAEPHRVPPPLPDGSTIYVFAVVVDESAKLIVLRLRHSEPRQRLTMMGVALQDLPD